MFRGTCHHLIDALEGIYSRFVQNVKIAKPTFSARRDTTRTTAWACAIRHLFENLLPAASYSRRLSDLKVPNITVFSHLKRREGMVLLRILKISYSLFLMQEWPLLARTLLTAGDNFRRFTFSHRFLSSSIPWKKKRLNPLQHRINKKLARRGELIFSPHHSAKQTTENKQFWWHCKGHCISHF